MSTKPGRCGIGGNSSAAREGASDAPISLRVSRRSVCIGCLTRKVVAGIDRDSGYHDAPQAAGERELDRRCSISPLAIGAAEIRTLVAARRRPRIAALRCGLQFSILWFV